MKFAISLSICSLMVAGCNSMSTEVAGQPTPNETPIADEPDEPRDFTAIGTIEAAREVCRLWTSDSQSVETFITAARIDRDFGFSEFQEITALFGACAGDFGAGCPTDPNIGPDYTVGQCINECNACSAAVIRAVYAE